MVLKKTLEQFSELSESEQVKFVEYINSPKINTELLDAMSSNEKVERILNGGGIVDHYWVPFGKIEVKDEQGYVSANGKRAVQRSTFTSSYVHPKFGLTMGTREFTIYGNLNGQLDDWILN